MQVPLGESSPGRREVLTGVIVVGFAVGVWFVFKSASIVALGVGAGGMLQHRNVLPSRWFYAVGVLGLSIGTAVAVSADSHGLRLFGVLVTTAGVTIAVVAAFTRLQHNPEASTSPDDDHAQRTEIHDV